MKIQSMQFKFLITVISAMLAITVFIGGLSIYEVDRFIQHQTEDFVNVTCENNVAQINDDFGDMEKLVHIMESYVYGLIKNDTDIVDFQRQIEILDMSNDMFADVAKHADSAIAYYFRFAPEISGGTCGFFYSKINSTGEFYRFETTDLFKYDKNDKEHVGWYWQTYEAGKPIWLLPYYNQNNSTLMISYVVPLFWHDEFFGIVGMDFDYTVLTDKVHNISIYDNGFAHLEFEGADIYNADHAENEKSYANPDKYLSVSGALKNGMTLVVSANYDDIRQIRYEISLKILYVAIFLAVLFSLIAVYTVKKIVYPLKKLTEASVKLSNGEYDVDIIHSNTHEIKLLSTAFENMTEHLKEHERLQHFLANRDSLTGLRNANSYKSWSRNCDEEIKNKNSDFGVMVLDINCLKETNDRYGHEVGNKLIIKGGEIISATFKTSPVFRMGGDEFVVILKNTDLENVAELIKKLDDECSNESITVNEDVITISIAKGFARYEANRDSNFLDVFNRADDAMYENKREMKELK